MRGYLLLDTALGDYFATRRGKTYFAHRGDLLLDTKFTG